MNGFTAKLDKEINNITDDALLTLIQYEWPGNVRQLINVVQNMMLVCEGDTLTIDHIPIEIREGAGDDAGRPDDSLTGRTLEQIEKLAIRNALRANNGNREATATMLDIGERTLYRKLKEYGLK